MLSCEEVAKLVSESLDKALPLHRRIGVRIHLMMCKICREHRNQMKFIREALQRVAGGDIDISQGLSPEARERIRSRLQEET